MKNEQGIFALLDEVSVSKGSSCNSGDTVSFVHGFYHRLELGEKHLSLSLEVTVRFSHAVFLVVSTLTALF